MADLDGELLKLSAGKKMIECCLEVAELFFFSFFNNVVGFSGQGV